MQNSRPGRRLLFPFAFLSWVTFLRRIQTERRARWVAVFAAGMLLAAGASARAQSAAAGFGDTRDPAPEARSMADEVRLAGDYLLGRGVARDPAQSAYWYRKAADQGDPGAQSELGYLYVQGIGVQKSETEAARWFLRASAGGSLTGKLNLAVMYLKGRGVRQDNELALSLFTQLAEAGNARAQDYLGIMYYNGDGVGKDPAMAEKWFRKAARGKDAGAEYVMGRLYSAAPAHEHDPAKAKHYFDQAVRGGFVPAMHALAILLLQHPGLKGNAADDPVALLHRAAEAGAWRAADALGILARDGVEGTQDPMQAFRWFTIAIQQGGAEARAIVQGDWAQSGRLLSEDERQRESGIAELWARQHPNLGFLTGEAVLTALAAGNLDGGKPGGTVDAAE